MPRHCASLLFPWSTPPLSTAHQFGIVVRILASLTAFSMMLCTLSLDACVPHQTEDLPVLASIQPDELYQLGATISLANHVIHDPDRVLHGQLVEQQDAHLGRIRSRRPFVPATWKLLSSLSKLDIRVKQWMKHKWNTDYLGEYFKSPCLHSQGQFKATWNESAQIILSTAQSPAD